MRTLDLERAPSTHIDSLLKMSPGTEKQLAATRKLDTHALIKAEVCKINYQTPFPGNTEVRPFSNNNARLA